MNEASVHSLNMYWATMFGCRIAELRPAHGRAFVHAGFHDYEGVYAMMFGEAAPIVSVPATLLAGAQAAARAWRPGSIRRATQVANILGDHVDRVIGPAALLYADASSLHATPSAHPVRRLERDSEADRALVLALRAACTDAEWATGGSDLDDHVMFGAFAGTTLAAVAGYEVWGGRIAHLAVVTDPDWRGRALARCAVFGAAEHALAQGLVLQYRSLESNASSLRIARALGFVPFATSLAVRSRAQNA